MACLRVIARPGSGRIITEARGDGASREKGSRSGKTRWTRAEEIPSSVWIERANSPSIARTRLIFCRKEFIARPLFSSKSSHPGSPSMGTPVSASTIRARAASERGTETAEPSSETDTRKPALANVPSMELAVVTDKFE